MRDPEEIAADLDAIAKSENWRIYAPVFREAGVRYRNAHVCRHTYATTLLRRRVPMASVSRLLGHASIRTTVDLYGHLAVEDLAADVDAAYQDIEST